MTRDEIIAKRAARKAVREYKQKREETVMTVVGFIAIEVLFIAGFIYNFIVF